MSYELRKINVKNGGKKYEIEFVNSFVNCRDGFSHKTELYINGDCKNRYSTHYINRTWECYAYQTCMRGCVNQLKYNYIDCLRDNYKINNNFKVMNKKREKDFQKSIKGDLTIKLYNKILKHIENNFVKQARKKADDFVNQFKKDYDGLCDKTKEHLKNSGIVLTSEEQAKNVMKISKVFDVLFRMK